MPTRPARHVPPGARTQAQRQAEYDRRRPSAHERGYDDAWRRTRAAYLATEPLCQDCLEGGRCVPAIEVHHVAKLADHPELKHDLSNLRGLCRRHHRIRTRRGE